MTQEEKIEMRRQEKEAEWKAKQAEWDANRKKKPHELALAAPKASENPMMELVCNDRMGGKVRVKCMTSDTILVLKKLIAAHTGTRFDKIRLQKSHVVFKDHITVADYELGEGMQIEMYYN